MFHTPKTPRKKKPRGPRPECSTHDSETKEKQVSECLKSEVVEKPPSVTSSRKTARTARSGNTSSTAARQRRLELEAARAKAKLELEAAEAEAAAAQAAAAQKTAEIVKKKAKIQSELLEKELAADLSELANCSRSVSNSAVSSREKVKNWLDCSGSVSSIRPPTQALPKEMLENHGEQPPSDIEKLAHALEKVITTSSKTENHQLMTRLATSKELPIFAGDPLEWLHFREAFFESTRLCKYSSNENMWRLRKCLRGDAKEAAASLLMGNTTPEQVIEVLELRFGRPETILNKLVLQLKKIPVLPDDYHHHIVSFALKIKNYVTAVRAVEQSEFLQSPEMAATVIAKLPNSLISKWTDYVYSHRDSLSTKLEKLADFLYLEAVKTAESGVSHIYGQRKHDERKNPPHAVMLTDTNTESDKCLFCQAKAHNICNCPKFKRALRKDRWRFARTNRLCFKCLGSRHSDPSSCHGSNCDVEGCAQPHHRLLHWVAPKKKEEQTDSEPSCHNQPETHTVHTVATQSPKVLLKIVPLTVHGPTGSVHVHALLDEASSVSLIASDIADQVGLRGRKHEMRARSAWDGAELVCESEIVSVDITNYTGDRFTFSARKIKQLNLPVQKISAMDLKFEHILKVKDFKICECGVQAKVLLGQSSHDLIAPIVCVRGKKQREPYLTKTAVGWCVHGPLVSDFTQSSRFVSLIHDHSEQERENTEQLIYHLFEIEDNGEPVSPPVFSHSSESHMLSDAQLHDLVRKSFALDSIGIGTKPRQSASEARAIAILDNTAVLADNQWTVGLPWRYDSFVMPDSYPNAVKRLKAVENKMLANRDGYASRYKDRIQHLFSNDFARELRDEDECIDGRVWYLPHFGVDNPKKRKLRLVFDAAAKSGGFCLNDFLLQGPDCLQSLLGIMFRFREYAVGTIADIQDMYLRVKIKKDDCNAFRFLWGDKKYIMTSLVFGACCSPFIALYINQTKNTERFESSLPEAVNAIRKSQYMDDYIDSHPDKATAKKLIKDIFYIHQQGGFFMRNWLSNCPEVLSDTPKETLNDKAVRFNVENQPERTLGLLWYPGSDLLGFDLSLSRIPSEVLQAKRKPTKREILRIVMSIFDIHGFLGPFTIKAKILMQATWRANIEWDTEITDDLFTYFKDWLKQLYTIGNIRIPRWYFNPQTEGRFSLDSAVCRSPEVTVNETSRLQLHVFCDASPSGYAAVGYFRKINSNGSVQVSFIASKNRVSGLKYTSISRLELQSALLGSRLAETIKLEHRIKINEIFYWTDSTTVLHWIRNENKNYKVFIANRLGEICDLSRISEWHYVPTKMNPADLATKVSDHNLNNDSMWFTGPSFLYQKPEHWPRDPVKKEIISDEVLEIIHTVISENNNKMLYLPVPEPQRFSCWLRLLRSTAFVLLFIRKCKKLHASQLDVDLLKEAEILLIRHSQASCFSDEIEALRKNLPLKKDSRLRSLTPILDSDGVLRVGGRIDAVRGVDEAVKRPVILDGKDYMSRLLVKEYHVRAHHGYTDLVVNELRQKYWVLNLRPTVRTVASQCLICRMRRAAPVPPRLGDLPEGRLTHHQRPFSVCGVDLFGPVEVAVGRQRHKRYGVLFTCLTVRAVHIEVVASLTADALIMALRRMAARRGWPHTIMSDNGTNMRGADTELKKSFKDLDQTALTAEALNRNVTWRFIPPRSAHMAGAWERLIRSVKTSLKVVLKERAPKEEILITLLAEVENLINSRPLTHVSVDPCSDEALTPNHFLIGSSSNLPTPGVFNDSDLYLRRQWRTSQRLTDLFWQRWMREVLPALLPRTKWSQEGLQLNVGDLVVVADPSSPRNTWPKGIIVKVYPGADGRVRVVDIKTQMGVMKRPVTRVAQLLRPNECRSGNTGGGKC